MNSEKLCDYGCGRKAIHQFKNGKWCCSKIRQQCPKLTLKHSNRMRGCNNPMYNKTHSEKTREKISENVKGKSIGRVPWNKGKTGIFSEETLQKIIESSTGKLASIICV